MRTYMALKNTFWGLIYQVLVLLLAWVSRKVMVMCLSAAGIGLTGLFTNVISALSLAELGLGSAVLYRLFPAIASGDTDKLSQLMTFYRKAYHLVALVIACLGIILIPFLPWLVSGVSVGYGYLVIVYLLYLLESVGSYFFSYNRTLLCAMQQEYRALGIDIVFKVLIFAAEMAVLFVTKSLIWYLAVLISLEILNNAVVSWLVQKLYGSSLRSIELDKPEKKGIFRDLKNLFIMNLSGKITICTDAILISVMVSTIQTGLYSNYTLLTSALIRFADRFCSGIQGSIGDLMARLPDDGILIEDRICLR